MVLNEPVAANLYREYLLSLPDVKAVTLEEVGPIVDTDIQFLQQALIELLSLNIKMVKLR